MGAIAARTLEAVGATDVTFEFRGTTVTIPLALEAWPLDDIRAGRNGRAVKALLAGQRPPMRTHADVVELSHRMADAVGVTPLPETPADARGLFGAIPTLLHCIDNHGDDLEADLRRLFGVDYRDPAACTLRQVWVMVRRLLPESAVQVARNKGELPWSRGDIIAARSWEMWTRKPYPGRPPTQAELDDWLAKNTAQSKRLDQMADREEYYRSGQNMRDAGVEPDPALLRPKQPPHQPSDNPVDTALAVAMKNARRTPKGKHNGRGPQPGQPGFRNETWDPAGNSW